MTQTSVGAWLAFGLILVIAITADLGLFRRRTDHPPPSVAFLEIAAWIGLSIGFGLWVWFSRGRPAGLSFFSAYLIEKSLSIDNVLLFLMIFRAFGVPAKAQHKVLYTGIIGALVFRAVFIFGGIALLRRFHMVIYVFGTLLFLVAAQMLIPRKDSREGSFIGRLVRKIAPAEAPEHAESFFIRAGGRWRVTPLVVALAAVELADVIFAVDSVPAVLAITRDPFIAFTSNAFAILGLRALYFGLAHVLTRIRFLHQGLAGVLLFVAAKMLFGDRLPISAANSFFVIAAILATAAGASWLAPHARHGPTS